MQELSLSTKYKVWGGVYGYQSVDFGVRILPGLVRTLKAEKDDSSIFIEYNMKPIYTKNSKGQRVRIGTPGEPFNAPVVAKIYPEDNPYYNPETKEYQAYRAFSIRKLTESECLRLMDVPDDLILKLKNDSGLSKSAIYKLAGNSIVCACLRRIFEQIYFGEMTYGAQFDLFSVHQGFHAPMPSVINLVTLCSGYDSQAIALGQFCEEHDANYDLLAWAEFDPESKKPLEQQPAVIAHNTLFPQWADRNLGDMTKIDWAKWKSEHQGKEIDILTYSTPCQSISNAGKREGMKEGSDTRSAVLWYTENAIRELRPKFLLQENVKAIISQKNIDDLNSWKERVANLGYTNYCAIMNAKNYGVPQNRERFFMLSVRKDLTNIDGEPLCNYQFPKIQLLTRMVADLLDDECPTEYFLKPESVLKFLQYNEDKNETGIVYATIDHHLSLDEINGIRDKVLSECQE